MGANSELPNDQPILTTPPVAQSACLDPVSLRSPARALLVLLLVPCFIASAQGYAAPAASWSTEASSVVPGFELQTRSSRSHPAQGHQRLTRSIEGESINRWKPLEQVLGLWALRWLELSLTSLTSGPSIRVHMVFAWRQISRSGS